MFTSGYLCSSAMWLPFFVATLLTSDARAHGLATQRTPCDVDTRAQAVPSSSESTHGGQGGNVERPCSDDAKRALKIEGEDLQFNASIVEIGFFVVGRCFIVDCSTTIELQPFCADPRFVGSGDEKKEKEWWETHGREDPKSKWWRGARLPQVVTRWWCQESEEAEGTLQERLGYWKRATAVMSAHAIVEAARPSEKDQSTLTNFLRIGAGRKHKPYWSEKALQDLKLRVRRVLWELDFSKRLNLKKEQKVDLAELFRLWYCLWAHCACSTHVRSLNAMKASPGSSTPPRTSSHRRFASSRKQLAKQRADRLGANPCTSSKAMRV